MKLSEYVDKIRSLTEASFDKEFARLGIGKNKQTDTDKLPVELREKGLRFKAMIENHIGETGSYVSAREKLIDELSFTLFNRLATIKVMEAVGLFAPVLTKDVQHGDRSFAHKAWLETNPHMRSEEREGLREFIKVKFDELGMSLPLYSKLYPYALLPDVTSLNDIIDAFNEVEKDPQVAGDIWQSDDILGWLYESYNNAKKKAHKESGAKTEHDKVSIQSQVYTPRWVVQFLVENSLGKLYLEMYPDSDIRKLYKIANAPQTQERTPKALTEIRLIDPACGSGNFLLYAYDFFYALYIDQIENYGAEYNKRDIPRLIIENNLHGIDLDDRAVQLAQLGLFIKAKKNCSDMAEFSFKISSSDFFLPDYEVVRDVFENNENNGEDGLTADQINLIQDIWDNLKYAYKYGSLIRISERVANKFYNLQEKADKGNYFAYFEMQSHQNFSSNFFSNLKKAVAQYAKNTKNTFLATKTKDAVCFLELLTTSYDIAAANPPYTDSSDFGPDLKAFIEANYKKPYKFHTNLYATFIKRCYEFINENGYIAMVHPLTFMYIKTFEDVRKFIIEKTHIDLFVEWGYLGMFNPSARVDSALYVLKKEGNQKRESVFFKLNNFYEGKRYEILSNAYNEYLQGNKHDIVYTLPQSKLKIIKSWPFIYWISDEFREKFKGGIVDEYFSVSQGLTTSNNVKYLRFWWEVTSKISNKSNIFPYAKGGGYNKWYGNTWLILFEYIAKNIPEEMKSLQKQFKITSGRQSTKGASFRLTTNNIWVDSATMNIFVNSLDKSLYPLSIMNSKVSNYVLNCLNPTVNKQVGDLKRLPFVEADIEVQLKLAKIVAICINLKKKICKFSLIEMNFKNSPIVISSYSSDLKLKIRLFLDYITYCYVHILLNEALLNEEVFRIYKLTRNDISVIIDLEGESVGSLPVLPEAREAYLKEQPEFGAESSDEDISLHSCPFVLEYIKDLPVKEFSHDETETIIRGFATLYQNNNNLEDFCIRHQVNPINVWYWFKESNIIPVQRMHTLAMEFLADLIREILQEDADGIVPLVANAGAKILLDRIEDKFYEKGFSMAQFSGFDTVLGRPLNEYLSKYFFAELSDHLNLFMYLPKTPFIWHLSSGPLQGFDCYIIIYKWDRDKLLKLRSVYIEHRERSLINRQSDLREKEQLSAGEQNEVDKIYKQLQEIESFKQKIDELLAEGYNPVLDDGVGKNIAPLQKKKMISYDVLNPGQLKTYLNADW